MISAHRHTYSQTLPLTAPSSGWEEKTNAEGRKFYVDHNTRTTTWERPGLPISPPASPVLPSSPEPETNHLTNIAKSRVNSLSPLAGRDFDPVGRRNSFSFATSDGRRSEPRRSMSIAPLSLISQERDLHAVDLGSFESNAAIFAENPVIQALCKKIRPFRMPDRDRTHCFKCNVKFGGIQVVLRHHCRSCGDIYCNACSARRMPLPLPGEEYQDGEKVRVCDFCFVHNSAGDLNSLLRLSLIVRGKGAPTDSRGSNSMRIKAMKVLLLSVEHEEDVELQAAQGILSQSEQLSQGATGSCFSAHLLWIHRLGGLSAMWGFMMPGLTKESPPELRSLTCQWIEKIFRALPLPLSELTASFVAANGIPVLVECLDHADSMDAAAKALVEVVLGDVDGEAFASQEPLVLHILDLVTCADAPLQVCLSRVLIHIVVALPSTLRTLLDAGILFVFVSLLQCRDLELKGSALVLIATVLRGVIVQGNGDGDSSSESGSILAMMGHILRSIINIDVVSGLVSVLPLDMQQDSHDFESGADGHPLELAKRSLVVLEILSSYTYSRRAMYSHLTALNRICDTLSTAADILTGVPSVHDVRGAAALQKESAMVQSGQDFENLDSIAALCLKIMTNISLSQAVDDKEEFMSKFNFLESAARIAAFYPVEGDVVEEQPEMTELDRRLSRAADPNSVLHAKEPTFPLTVFEAIDLLSVYSVYAGFGQLVEVSGPSTALALVNLACRAVTFLCRPQCTDGANEMSGTILTTHMLSSVMLITYTLYHTYTATYSISRDLCAPALRSDEDHPRDMKLGDGSDREIFLVVAGCRSLMASVTSLVRDTNKSSHASRLLQVLGATPYPSVLATLWKNVDSCHVVPALIDCGSSLEENVNNVENALLALGTLAGAPALFPWECALLAQKVNAVMKEVTPSETGDIEINMHTNLMDPRSRSLMLAAQVRAQLRIDPRRCAGVDSKLLVLDTGDENLDWEYRSRQQETERQMRKELCGLVSRLVTPSLCCGREGVRVVASSRLVQLLSNETEFSLHSLGTTRGIYTFSQYLPSSDLISRLCLIDALSFLFGGLGSDMSDPPSDVYGEACVGLELVCKEIWGYDAAVLSRALFTVNEARIASSYYWQTISSSALAAFVNMLDLHCHITIGSVDSVYVVKMILSILSCILLSQGVAVELMGHQRLMNHLSRYTMLANGFASRQVIDTSLPQHRSPDEISDYRSDDVEIQRLAIDCVKSISSISVCRASFLAAGGCSSLFNSLVEYIASYYESMNPASDDDKRDDDFKTQAAIDGPVVCLLPKGGAMPSTNCDLPSVALLSTMIDTLYFLSCERSSALRDGLLQAHTPHNKGSATKVIIKFLLEVWSRNIDVLSTKLVAIFMRLGVVDSTGSSETDIETEPWVTLLRSQQVYFLFDMIGYRNVSVDSQLDHNMDETSLIVSQANACSCLRQVVSVDLTCREAVVATCEHRLVVNSEGRTQPAPNLLLLLEMFAPQFPSAALCLAEVFAWQEVNYRYTSGHFAQSMINVLTAASEVTSRCAALRLFSAGMLHSDGSREQTLRTLPLATIARSTQEILHMCVAAVDSSGGDGGWLDEKEFGIFTEQGEVRVPETLVSGVVVASSLLHQMAQQRHYYDQQTQSLSTDEALLQVTCCRAIRVLLKEWTRQRRAKWSTVKLIPLDSAHLAVWLAVQWFSLYPHSANDLLTEAVIDVMAPALQLHVKEMSNTAAQLQLSGKESTEHTPYTYCPSEDLGCCLAALSNLLEQYEDRATDVILETGMAVELMGVLFQRVEHKEFLPLLVTILHKVSCTDTSACNELIECGADAVRAYGLREYSGEDDDAYKFSTVDWLVDHLQLALEMRMGIHDAKKCAIAFGAALNGQSPSVDDVPFQLAVITTQMADTLSNLCRVKKARERVVSHASAFMNVLCDALMWDLKCNEYRMYCEVKEGWSYATPVEAGLVPTLSALLSVMTILAPAMYDSHGGEILCLPLDLVPACLFVASHCPDIKCVDQALSIVLILCIHPSLSSPLVARRPIRLLFKALGRFCPQVYATDAAIPAQAEAEYDLLQSLVCDKCLRLVQHVLTANTDVFMEAMKDHHSTVTCSETDSKGPTYGTMDSAGMLSTHTSVDWREVELPVGLVLSVVRVSVGATRNLEWYPCLLRSADILQLLALNGDTAKECIDAMRDSGVSIATGSLKSHVLINSLRGFDYAAQPALRQSVRPYVPSQAMCVPSAVTPTLVESSGMDTIPVYEANPNVMQQNRESEWEQEQELDDGDEELDLHELGEELWRLCAGATEEEQCTVQTSQNSNGLHDEGAETGHTVTAGVDEAEEPPEYEVDLAVAQTNSAYDDQPADDEVDADVLTLVDT